MKTTLSIILVSVLLLTSCGNSETKDGTAKESNELTEETLKGVDSKKAKDCDEFIDQYEEWMDNYIEMVDKFMKNPMDASLLQKYSTLGQEYMNWMTQWNGKLAYCASKEKHSKRFDEITAKAEKKLEELGIE